VSAGTTTITITDPVTLVSATGVVTVANSAIANVVSSTDSSSYDLATKVKWLVTAKDSTNSPVADGNYVGFWTSAPVTNVNLQGWTGNGDTTTLSTVAGVSEVDVYAPVTPGSNVAITGGVISKDGAVATALQATTVADATFTVNGGADSSAATDAANAATDAANAAADAADNATQAASEALAAVNSLATTVASLIAGIKAQITSLTNLITKIKNKVGA
jgi:flagellin-like hook-associated protein FlgL